MSVLFETARLYTRPWVDTDLMNIRKLHQDPKVMQFFPGTASDDACAQFLTRMQALWLQREYAYLPVFSRSDDEFIGWVGLGYQTYLEAPFTDIGWRILPEYWGNGYATEMARGFLEYGFQTCGLDAIDAVAPSLNRGSIAVMKRIGMEFVSEFDHPMLSEEHCPDYQHLQRCVLCRSLRPST